MVLLVLAVVWAVLLVSWLRSRTDRQLLRLGRLVPPAPHRAGAGRRPTVMPANRLRSGPVGGAPAACRPVPVASGSGYRRPMARSPGRSGPRQRPPSGAGRPRSGAGTCSSLCWPGWSAPSLVAIIPGLSVMWAVQVVFDAGLRRLRGPAGPDAQPGRRAGAQADLHASAALGAARPRPAYDLGGDYGELSLRRAAN